MISNVVSRVLHAYASVMSSELAARSASPQNTALRQHGCTSYFTNISAIKRLQHVSYGRERACIAAAQATLGRCVAPYRARVADLATA